MGYFLEWISSESRIFFHELEGSSPVQRQWESKRAGTRELRHRLLVHGEVPRESMTPRWNWKGRRRIMRHGEERASRPVQMSMTNLLSSELCLGRIGRWEKRKLDFVSRPVGTLPHENQLHYSVLETLLNARESANQSNDLTSVLSNWQDLCSRV